MPIEVISGDEALARRKGNPFAAWGHRNQQNRIEPIASPGFALPFRLDRGGSVFTVGSCFARNVETRLQAHGFKVPMRELLFDQAFDGLEAGALNNFAVPSIWNELAWAMGEAEYETATNIAEVAPGRFVDLHLVHSVRPADRMSVLARRQAVKQAYASFTACRLAIITLGLTEVWFDRAAGVYINAQPLPGLLRAQPERFELHVLTYGETLDYLDRALGLLFRHGLPDLNVIITVSPVPLGVTHRDADVMTANGYSKAVLRAAAEEVAAKHARVTYLPIYEAVTLSDRKRTWADDLTHVTDEIVAHNVGRLVDALCGSEHDPEAARRVVAAGGADAALELLPKIRAASVDAVRSFLAEHGELGRDHAGFALEHARHLAECSDHAGALAVLEAHRGPATEAIALTKAQCLIALRRTAEAGAVLEGFESSRSQAYWTAMFKARCAQGNSERVLTAMQQWSQALPKQAARAHALAARWHQEIAASATTADLIQRAIALDPLDPLVRIVKAETLLATGDVDGAEAILAHLRPEAKHHQIMADRLAVRVKAARAALVAELTPKPVPATHAALPAVAVRAAAPVIEAPVNLRERLGYDPHEAGGPLSAAEIGRFREDGFIVRRIALDPELQDKAIALAWDEVRKMNPEFVPEQPWTWTGEATDSCRVAPMAKRRGRIKLREQVRDTPWLAGMIRANEQILAPVRSLLGPGGMPRRKIRGLYPIFPSPSSSTALSGGMDAHPFQISCIVYLSDVAEQGGAFNVWRGSHELMRHAFPGKASWTIDPVKAEELRIEAEMRYERVSLPGPAGTMILWHHRLLHTPSTNRTRSVRHALIGDFLQDDWEARREEPHEEDIWAGWGMAEAVPA